jgi:acetoin:2,6-dichlorophenolindophenol oxidoreductase subunit beta
VIFSAALNQTLHAILDQDPRVVLLGEDIADPYGGAFKVTKGLTTRFPTRVRTTPVSESALTGIAGGLALRGFRPVVEIMFGDFITLCFDQMVNHISKYGPMYDGQATCPVVLRTPSGGGRGYGPTHSQSLEKHYLGVPNLRVVAASLYHDPLQVFTSFLTQDEPVLYVEHKLLYPQHMTEPAQLQAEGWIVGQDASPGALPTVTLSAVPREQCTATVVAYGYQATQVAKVAQRLAVQEEVFVEVLIPAQIAPVDWSPIERSAASTGSLLTVEEGTAGWSWGSGVAEHVHRALFGSLRRPVAVVTSDGAAIPSARDMEAEMLVSQADIERAMLEAA